MNAVIQELISPGIYKRSQGRVARQVTFAVLAVSLLLGCWRLSQSWIAAAPGIRFAIPSVLLLLGVWVSYRLVNLPKFADFLIAVEAEMNKVSWPSRGELFRASMVVLVCIFLLAAVLFGYDLFWQSLLYDWLKISGETPPA